MLQVRGVGRGKRSLALKVQGKIRGALEVLRRVLVVHQVDAVGLEAATVDLVHDGVCNLKEKIVFLFEVFHKSEVIQLKVCASAGKSFEKRFKY